MVDSFDPYYKWLAIPPNEQPPNHYRLLGIPLYTDDADVISNAADQRMAHVRSFQVGNHSAASQRILSELANSRLCLLNAFEKASYDNELKKLLVHPPAPPVISGLNFSDVEVSAPSVAETVVGPEKNPSIPSRRKVKGSPGLTEMIKIIAGSVGGLFIGYLILCFIGPQYDFLGLMGESSERHAMPNSTNEVAAEDVEESGTKVSDVPANSQEPTTSSPPVAHSSVGESVVRPSVDDNSTSPATVPTESTEEQVSRLSAERDKAIDRGSLSSALSLTKKLAELTGEDVFEMQAVVLLEKRDNEASEFKRMRASALVSIIEALFATDRISFARSHQDDAVRLTRETGDPELIRRATLAVLRIQQTSTTD